MTVTVRDTQFEALIEQYPHRPRILAEGDPWFSRFLLYNMIDEPAYTGDYHILNLAMAADEIADIASGIQLARLRAAMEHPRFDFDVLLLSAGGNDILGNDETLYREIQPGQPAETVIVRDELERRIQVIREHYVKLIELRNECSPNTRFWFHGYDIPYASGEKAKLFWPIGDAISDLLNVGPWLKGVLEDYGVATTIDQRKVARALLRALDDLFGELDDPDNGIYYVRTQGSIASRRGWADEIHPNRQGYSKILENLRPLLSEVTDRYV